MRYLRMLTNAFAGGLLGAAYIAVLFLQLNPQVPLHRASLTALAGTVGLFYALHLAVLLYAAIVVRQLIGAAVSPAWISLRWLSWFAACAAAGAAGLMAFNVRTLQTALGPEAVRGMTTGAAAASVSALAFLAIAVVQYAVGRRGRRVMGGLFVLAATVAVAVPVIVRGLGQDRPLGAYRLDVSGWMMPVDAPARVVLVLLDGASLDYISPAAAEGRLPNFGRLLDAGAAMHLATVQPTQPEPVWTTVATGKYPWKHGVRSAAVHDLGGDARLEILPDLCFSQALVRFGFLDVQAHTSASLRARPLWSILSGLGVSVGIVGWPVTYPAQPVLGYLASDRLHRVREQPLAPDVALAAYPPDLVPLARRLAAGAPPSPAIARVSAGGVALPPDGDLSVEPPDWLYARLARELQAREPAQFVAVRYQGLDAVGHQFLRYAMPRSFGDVTEEEQQRFGSVLDRYYRLIDREVGAAIDGLGPADLLLVVSGFGMEPVTLGKRLFGRLLGDADLTGSHEQGPDGFLLAYGSAVEPGHPPRGALVDVAPTVLYFLGLPVGRDFDGYARTDLFRREFTAARPITFIPSYER